MVHGDKRDPFYHAQNQQHRTAGLSTNVNELQRQAIPSEPPGAHTQRIGALEGQKQDAQTNVNHLSTQLDTLTSRRKDMAQKFQDLREQRARIDQLAMQQEPEITNKLSLYAHISRLSFNLDHYPRKLSGVVASEDVQGPQTFELELSTLSQCQIADKLWGLMEC